MKNENNDENNDENKRILDYACLLWMIDYTTIKFYLLNKVYEIYNNESSKEENKSDWVLHLSTLGMLFPMDLKNNLQQ